MNFASSSRYLLNFQLTQGFVIVQGPTVGKARNCMDWIARGVEGSGCCVLVNGPDWIGATRQLQTRGASRSAARLGRRCPLAKIRFGAPASNTRKESGESFKVNLLVSYHPGWEHVE